MKRFWGQHFLPLELGAAILAFGVFLWISVCNPPALAFLRIPAGNRSELYDTVGSVVGALLGFVIAAVAIVLGYAQDERFKILRGSRHYEQLWKIFVSSARWLAAGTVTTVLALLYDRDSRPVPFLFYAFVVTNLVAAVRIARVVWALEKIVWIVVRRTESTTNHS